jgi:hypothetical protein
MALGWLSSNRDDGLLYGRRPLITRQKWLLFAIARHDSDLAQGRTSKTPPSYRGAEIGRQRHQHVAGGTRNGSTGGPQ